MRRESLINDKTTDALSNWELSVLWDRLHITTLRALGEAITVSRPETEVVEWGRLSIGPSPAGRMFLQCCLCSVTADKRVYAYSRMRSREDARLMIRWPEAASHPSAVGAGSLPR